MTMSKRKGSTAKERRRGKESEGGEGSPTVHVSSDMLAGSPDIWAPGKDKPVESFDVAPDVTSENAPPPAEAQAESEESPSMGAVEPAFAEDHPTEPVPTDTPSTPPPPPAHHPPPPPD